MCRLRACNNKAKGHIINNLLTSVRSLRENLKSRPRRIDLVSNSVCKRRFYFFVDYRNFTMWFKCALLLLSQTESHVTGYHDNSEYSRQLSARDVNIFREMIKIVSWFRPIKREGKSSGEICLAKSITKIAGQILPYNFAFCRVKFATSVQWNEIFYSFEWNSSGTITLQAQKSVMK